MQGTIPPEISEWSSLTDLSLQDGAITGVIPSEIGTLTFLKVIDLNFNLIGGTIPTQLYDLPMLDQLDLNDNELTGSIHTAIGQLNRLTFLQLENNRMTGTIPRFMGNMRSLGTFCRILLDIACRVSFCIPQQRHAHPTPLRVFPPLSLCVFLVDQKSPLYISIPSPGRSRPPSRICHSCVSYLCGAWSDTATPCSLYRCPG